MRITVGPGGDSIRDHFQPIDKRRPLVYNEDVSETATTVKAVSVDHGFVTMTYEHPNGELITDSGSATLSTTTKVVGVELREVKTR
jgi:hypothetical protein